MAPHDHSAFFFIPSLFARYKLKETTESQKGTKLCQKANLDGQPATTSRPVIVVAWLH